MSPVPIFTRRRPKRIKLGVVANEFFDRNVGRMGGFGWAAAQVARCFAMDAGLGVDVVYLTGGSGPQGDPEEVVVHGVRLLKRAGPTPYTDRVRREAPDLLLLIDYRPDYLDVLEAVPRTPVILWVRDPRPPEDVRKVQTLEIPDTPGVRPSGIDGIDCTSFGSLYRRSRWRLRPVLVAAVTPFLRAKVPGTYGVAPRRVSHLPNIIHIPALPASKTANPSVVFLGRLDPVKRPWLLFQIARRLPRVDFLVLGAGYVEGPGGWTPSAVPANVRLLGHVDGPTKTEVVGAAWALVNTSIHEGLALSFLEALAVGTPIVSCQDPEDVTSRFGVFVGRWAGAGVDSVTPFVEALEGLLGDEARRARLGHDGRAWVAGTHTRERFLETFGALCRGVGLRPAFGSAGPTPARPR